MFRYKQGPIPALALFAQMGHGLLQRGQPAGLKVAYHTGKIPGSALPYYLLTEGAGAAQTVKVPAVQHHPSAGRGRTASGAEQVGALAHTVGQVGGGDRQAPDLPELVRCDGDGKANGRHGDSPLSKFFERDMIMPGAL